MDSARLLRAGTTLTCFYFDTQKTIWMPCAESTVQDKRSPDVRTRDPLTKSKLREKSRENSREAWKTSLFSTATKAIRKANIPLSPLPGEWSCSVTVFRAAKASLLVVERALPHLTIHTTASLPRSLQLCTCWPNWTLDAGYSWEHKHGHKHPCSYLFTFQPFLEQSRELENFLPVFQHRLEGTANIPCKIYIAAAGIQEASK